MPNAADNMETKQNGRPGRGAFFKTRPAYLVLQDGASFAGEVPVWQDAEAFGETVFNTGMTGYVETLTDPSYSGQILTFTFPLIGNYGVELDKVWESTDIHTAGVVVSEACSDWSHSSSYQSLLEWLRHKQVPIIMGVDTRALTKHLRSAGTMLGVISSDAKADFSQREFSTPHVTVDEPTVYNLQYDKLVVLVDCGMKHNILRSLLDRGVRVIRVPANYDFTKEDYDGVVYSNGPGDPTEYPRTVEVARRALAKNKPVFGICLGTQIMALAAGAKTYKLRFGHRGHNQPCQDSAKHCFITSQNHGYAIDDKSLPADWQVSFRNLNDNSVEGIAHKTKPFFSVQFHPEASPGPTDTAWLFDKFIESL